MAFLFAYSMREKTHAHRNLVDDVPETVKQRRVKEMIDTFTKIQSTINQAEIGKLHVILLEGKAKRQENTLMGKTDNFKNSYAKVSKVSVYKKG
jgi:tRNA A37 methylthiotransferase MiaB